MSYNGRMHLIEDIWTGALRLHECPTPQMPAALQPWEVLRKSYNGLGPAFTALLKASK